MRSGESVPGGVAGLRARRVENGKLAASSRVVDPAVWDGADWSPRFVDMATGRPVVYSTVVACQYDDELLSFAFECEDPFPAAALTERDSLVFQENDIEVFVDFGFGYYELELNALNTVYEVLHVWRDTSEGWGPRAAFERSIWAEGAVTFGGDDDRTPATFWTGGHPRGLRVAFLDFDLDGLASAVEVDGALNAPDVVSRGWRAELHLPWPSLSAMAGFDLREHALANGLRALLARFQQVPLGEVAHSAAWCLTPHGRRDSHRPESFTTVTF